MINYKKKFTLNVDGWEQGIMANKWKDKVEAIDENKITFKNLEDFSEEELLEVDNYI